MQVAGKYVRKYAIKVARNLEKVQQWTTQKIMKKQRGTKQKICKKKQKQRREKSERKVSCNCAIKYREKVARKQGRECSRKVARNEAKIMPEKQQETSQ